MEEENFQRVMDAASAVRQRSGAPELIYKTHNNDTPAQQPQKDKIFTDKQGEALGYVIAELLKEISELRTEIEILKAGNVEQFRKTNAA